MWVTPNDLTCVWFGIRQEKWFAKNSIWRDNGWEFLKWMKCINTQIQEISKTQTQ